MRTMKRAAGALQAPIDPINLKVIEARAARCTRGDLVGHKRLIGAEVHIAPSSRIHGHAALAAWRWGWELGLEGCRPGHSALEYRDSELQRYVDEGHSNGVAFRSHLGTGPR